MQGDENLQKKCDIASHQKFVRKKLRNTGKEYISKDGTQRQSRVMGSCSCRMHCFEKISQE